MNNYYNKLGIPNLVDQQYLTNLKVVDNNQVIPQVSHVYDYDSFNNIYLKNIPNGLDRNLNGQTGVFDSYEGFIRGNMFKDLYDPYKGDQVKNIVPVNEKEKLMLDIYQNNFAMLDLNLYLDVNPDNMNAIQLYNQYREQYLKSLNEYEQRYGPLTVNSNTLYATPWAWLKTRWPWDGER